MDIYQTLTNDHDRLKPLLDQLVAASEVNDNTKDILNQIRDLLVPHSRAEEAVFYNSLRGLDLTKELVMDGYREHLEAETLLRSLRGLEKINIEWTAAAKKLRDILNHHIADEEDRIFPQSKQVLLDEEVRQMAVAFDQLKQKATEQGDLKNSLDLIANMMPNRFSQRMREMDTSNFNASA
jgi:hemerythrin superfamily protein